MRTIFVWKHVIRIRITSQAKGEKHTNTIKWNRKHRSSPFMFNLFQKVENNFNWMLPYQQNNFPVSIFSHNAQIYARPNNFGPKTIFQFRIELDGRPCKHCLSRCFICLLLNCHYLDFKLMHTNCTKLNYRRTQCRFLHLFTGIPILNDIFPKHVSMSTFDQEPVILVVCCLRWSLAQYLGSRQPK